MNRLCSLLKLVTVLSAIALGDAQQPTVPAPIAYQDTCMIEQGIPDNLSCNDDNDVLICFPMSDLCNGVEDCLNGFDEDRNLNDLDCDGRLSRLPYPVFFCEAITRNLTDLCDGVAHCDGGADENVALCENKCLFPYYGACDYSRECEVTDLASNCGLCRPGWAEDTADLRGTCLFAFFRFSTTSFSVRENEGPLLGSVTLDTQGELSEAVTISISTVQSGTAIANSDYIPSVVQVTFPARSGGGTTLTFEIPILDDTVIENTENFMLSASAVNDRGNFSTDGDTANAFIIDNDVFQLGYALETYSTNEGISIVEVCLVTEANTAILREPRIFNVFTTDISPGAFAGLDYEAVQSQVTFSPGDTEQCYDITIIDDNLDEIVECFQLGVSDTTPATDVVIVLPTAQVCIVDNDVLDFQLSSTTYNVNEGDGVVQVCINLIAGSPQQSIPVTLTTTSVGNAIGDTDYTSIESTVLFQFGAVPNGAGGQMCVNIPITDDNLVEFSESFGVSLSSTNNQAGFPSGTTGTVFIADNDVPMFRFTSGNYPVGEAVGDAIIEIELFESELTFPVTVTVVDVAGGNALDGIDYMGVLGTLTFQSGSGIGTVESFGFSIIDDTFVENSETISLSATVGGPGQITGTDGAATVVIIDNDVCEVGFTEQVYTAAESVGDREVCLMKTNSAVLTENIDVQIFASPIAATADKDSAQVGADYALSAGNIITIGPGIAFPCLDISIIGDSIDERNEFFRITAQSTDNSVLTISGSSGSAQVCITDDDVLMFRLTQGVISVGEGDGIAPVCVELVSGSANRLITINLNTGNLNALDSMDYSAGGYTVSFAPNAPAGTELCANVVINNDLVVENSESFQVFGSSIDNQVTFSTGGAVSTVSIIDNDFPRFQFTQLLYSVNEANGPVTVGVALLDRTLSFPITVTVLDIVGGSATDGGDYIGVGQSLTFNAGDGPGQVQEFTITIQDDITDEGLEDFILQGSVGAPGSFPQNEARVEITDDDVCMVRLVETIYSILENTGNVRVCLEKTNSVQLSAPVNLLISTGPAPASPGKGAAIAGLDYTPQVQVALTFMPGSNIECIDIPINDDSLDELTENFAVNVMTSNADSIVVMGDSSAEVCIQDDDLIEFAFDMSVYATAEGDPAIQICVNLIEGTLTRDVIVDVDNVIGFGTATLNMDYGTVSPALTFPAGSASSPTQAQMCFFFSPINDVNVETLENFQLSLSSQDDQAEFPAGGGSAIVNIDDNDQISIRIVPNPNLGLPDFTIPENGGSQRVCVDIVNPSSQDNLEKPVTIILSSADGTAFSGSDYSAVTTQLIFNPSNQRDELCVDINIFNDAICEDDEVLTISLTSSDDCVDILMPSQGSITIIDDDVAQIGPDQGVINYNVTERLDESVWIPIRLTGNKGPGRQCDVVVTTMDGTAMAGMDYVMTETTLTFDNTNELQMFHVEILDDTLCEGHESFLVFLRSDSDGCNITQDQLYVYIWDDEVHFGDDPHFSIALPGGNLLCYTVQGEHGFSFNLISNELITMNSKFVPDARRSEVTWLGSMGIIVQDSQYKSSNSTKLRFESSNKRIYIDDKVSLEAKNIEKLTFSNGKMLISEAPPTPGFRYPSVMVDLQDVEISFTIKFTNQHLDMYWHSTGKKITDSHGLIGQFFRNGVEIDEVRKILIMSNKEPVPVMRRPVWAFMEREEKDDQLCWTAMNSGYQGEGLIDGSYFDYLVDDVMSTDFKFNRQ